MKLILHGVSLLRYLRQRAFAPSFHTLLVTRPQGLCKGSALSWIKSSGWLQCCFVLCFPFRTRQKRWIKIHSLCDATARGYKWGSSVFRHDICEIPRNFPSFWLIPFSCYCQYWVLRFQWLRTSRACLFTAQQKPLFLNCFHSITLDPQRDPRLAQLNNTIFSCVRNNDDISQHRERSWSWVQRPTCPPLFQREPQCNERKIFFVMLWDMDGWARGFESWWYQSSHV